MSKVCIGGEFLISEMDASDVFTPEDFTEEHRMIRETARDFVKNDIDPRREVLEHKDTEVVRSLFSKCGELGLLGADVPEEYGGLGLDKVSATIIGEVLGGLGSFSVVYSAHTGIGTAPINYFGNDAQKKKYLGKLASGEFCGAYCLTEAGAGSDALAAKTKAVLTPDGKHYVLNGEKVFISNAGWADTFIVYAKVDGTQFTGFILEKDMPGLSLGREEEKMGMKGSSTRSVILEDVKVPVENVLFEVGQGHKIAFNVLNLGRWKLGAGSAGACKLCLVGAVTYANQRQQFGVPISSFGMIQNKLADMTIRTYHAESMMYRLAGMFDDKLATIDPAKKKDGAENAKSIEEYAIECSISKIYGSEMLDFCTDEYVQCLGGYGYISEYPAERYFRDARINRIWEGTNEINRLLVPGTLMKRAMGGRLKLMEAAMAIPKELLTYSPLRVELSDEPLARETHLIKMAKKLALMVSGVAAQKFAMGLEKEQEVLASIADMVIEIFAMESGLLRAKKAVQRSGLEKNAEAVAVVEVYVDETMPKLEQLAKKVVCYAEEGDMQRTQLAGIKKLARFQNIDTISRKKKIAALVIARENYPF